MYLVIAEAAQGAVQAAATVGESMGWKEVAIGALSMVLMALARWASAWISSQGSDLVREELKKAQTKINENTLMGQIKADDAVFAILDRSIPLVLARLHEEVAKAGVDGKITEEEMKVIAASLWEIAKPQITGGWKDYLKESSWEDGKLVAEMALRQFFAKQKLSQVGLKV
jgi:hypothetical protein